MDNADNLWRSPMGVLIDRLTHDSAFTYEGKPVKDSKIWHELVAVLKQEQLELLKR